MNAFIHLLLLLNTHFNDIIDSSANKLHVIAFGRYSRKMKSKGGGRTHH